MLTCTLVKEINVKKKKIETCVFNLISMKYFVIFNIKFMYLNISTCIPKRYFLWSHIYKHKLIF
jgi:hypothetical protein